MMILKVGFYKKCVQVVWSLVRTLKWSFILPYSAYKKKLHQVAYKRVLYKMSWELVYMGSILTFLLFLQPSIYYYRIFSSVFTSKVFFWYIYSNFYTNTDTNNFLGKFYWLSCSNKEKCLKERLHFEFVFPIRNVFESILQIFLQRK